MNFRVPGGGESVGDLGERICQAFDEIREREKGKDIALVVHGAVNRVILCQAG